MPPGGLKWMPFAPAAAAGWDAGATRTAGSRRRVERTCEGFVRRVARLESDREHVGPGRQQPVRGPLEQDPPPQRAGRLARDGCDDPVGVEPGEMQPRGQPGTVHAGLVEGVAEDANKAGERVGSGAHTSRSSPHAHPRA